MSNPRITKRDKGLIKGALRRVFSRSELRNSIITANMVEYSDLSRPRVKKWVLCNICKKPEAKSYVVVDHIDPFVPIGGSFEEMSLDVAVDRLWCEVHNLQAICPNCHELKSTEERQQRKKLAKPKTKCNSKKKRYKHE